MRTWATAAGLLLLAISVVPVLLVDIPAMGDYTNHLARMHVLVTNNHPHYEARWSLYPNLAMDLIVPQLARLMTTESAARVFLLLSQVLVVTGAMAVEFSVKGRIALSAFIAPMTLYSLPFAWGFVNFQFGLGLALWSIAGWLVMQGKTLRIRLLVHSLSVAALFVSHLFALGVYGLTIGLYELWRVTSQRRSLKDIAKIFGMMAAPAVCAFVLALVAAPSISVTRTEWSATSKLAALLWWTNGYDQRVAAVAAVVICASAWTARPRLSPAGGWTIGGFFLFFLVTPNWLLDTAFVDVRLLVAGALLLPAFIVVSATCRRPVFIAAAALAIFTVANAAHAAIVWTSYRDVFVQLKESFRHIPHGSFVLIAHSGQGQVPPPSGYDYPLYHAPTLAVAYSGALVPSFFTYPGKQPIVLKPGLENFDGFQTGPVPLQLLIAIASGGGDEGAASFVRDWHHRYQYVYVVGDKVSNPLPLELLEIFPGDRFVLYRVTPRKSRSGAP